MATETDLASYVRSARAFILALMISHLTYTHHKRIQASASTMYTYVIFTTSIAVGEDDRGGVARANGAIHEIANK